MVGHSSAQLVWGELCAASFVAHLNVDFVVFCFPRFSTASLRHMGSIGGVFNLVGRDVHECKDLARTRRFAAPQRHEGQHFIAHTM